MADLDISKRTGKKEQELRKDILLHRPLRLCKARLKTAFNDVFKYFSKFLRKNNKNITDIIQRISTVLPLEKEQLEHFYNCLDNTGLMFPMKTLKTLLIKLLRLLFSSLKEHCYQNNILSGNF